MKRRIFLQVPLALGVSPILRAEANILIPTAYQEVAHLFNVPVNILYSIALAESGRPYFHILKPWPWALNIDGKGVYCLSETQALAIVISSIQNQQQVDIGIMQISWRWHQQAFLNESDALNPMKNLRVGANILLQQYHQTGDWWKAVGRYHDPGLDQQSLMNAENYRLKVKEHWQGLIL